MWENSSEEEGDRSGSRKRHSEVLRGSLPAIREGAQGDEGAGGYGLYLRKASSSFMSTSSSDGDLLDSELPFAMEMGALSLGGGSPQASPHSARVQTVEGDNAFVAFLRRYSCFDLVPDSGKVVAIDDSLSLVDAFAALREHGIRSAPLWDADAMRFVGVVSHSDFVVFLHHCVTGIQRTGTQLTDQLKEQQALEQLKKPLRWWRTETKSLHTTLISMSPDDTVADAVEALLRFKVHRLAVYAQEEETLLFMLSFRQILKYLVVGVGSSEPSFNMTIRSLNLGRQLSVEVGVSPATNFFAVVERFVKEQSSSLPILDQHGRVLSVVSKNDIKAVVLPGFWRNLHSSLGDVMQARHGGMPSAMPWLVTLDDTLGAVCSKLREWRLQRLYVVSPEGVLQGDLRISEVFSWLYNKEK